MARRSVNNGTSYVDLSDLSDDDLETLFVPLMNLGEDEAREQTHSELAPCTTREFMTRYLELAKEDLLIG
jgi:hypothetical protein